MKGFSFVERESGDYLNSYMEDGRESFIVPSFVRVVKSGSDP